MSGVKRKTEETMGMFNMIFADLLCPVKGKLSENVEIQIKWQDHEKLALDIYHIGDTLPGIEPGYDNVWIRTDYVCPACSWHSKGWEGMPYIKRRDQSRHQVFVRIEKAKICAVLTEEEFEKTGARGLVDYL